jgi:hypothetical protein
MERNAMRIMLVAALETGAMKREGWRWLDVGVHDDKDASWR